MRTVGTIGIPARNPPARVGSTGWGAPSPLSTRVIGGDPAARRPLRGAWLVSAWLVLLGASWAVLAGLVWLLLYALGTA
jgi:hypothetical protein